MNLPDESASRPVTMLDAGGPNAIAVTTGIVGDEWTLWIVQMALNAGFTHYNDWLRAGPISSSVLTARLARLVEIGIFDRIRYTARPPRYDYRLTPRGRQMWPILVTMWAWEQRWVDHPERPMPLMRHAGCGCLFAPVVVCNACGEPGSAADVRGRFGPSWSWERSTPSAATRRRARSGSRPHELVTQTMAVIGNRWSAALLNSAFLGATRFGEFEQQMGAPPTIVADRLRTFCELGFLDQSPSAQRPDWVTYHLTPKGQAFFPVVAEAVEWGQRWFHSPEGHALEQEHVPCGHEFHPRLICDQCHGRLRGKDVQVDRDNAGDAAS
jgi:DNA-binding HxlR family transcriptional regulator